MSNILLANIDSKFPNLALGEFLEIPRNAAYRLKYNDEVEPYLTGGGK